MARLVFESTSVQHRLPELLEGYLYGLGETCHALFGADGEAAVYRAIGRFYTGYLSAKLGTAFDDPHPWRRFCQIMEFFTSHGFYSRVEMDQVSEGRYWLLETGQYAGGIWEEQKSWERGTPPCPLFAVTVYSLAEIRYRLVLDRFDHSLERGGFESWFHFEPTAESGDPLDEARRAIRRSLIPICAQCKKIRDETDRWVTADVYFAKNYQAKFTHGLCSACADDLHRQILASRPGVSEPVES